MNITIKSLKVLERASRETQCFECTVYVDGKRAFYASNEGSGGPNRYDTAPGADRTLIEKAMAYASTRPDAYGNSEDLDVLIDELAEQKRVEKVTKNILAKSVLFVVSPNSTELQKVTYKNRAKPDARLIQQVRSKHPDAVILNEMPLEQAAAFMNKLA